MFRHPPLIFYCDHQVAILCCPVAKPSGEYDIILLRCYNFDYIIISAYIFCRERKWMKVSPSADTSRRSGKNRILLIEDSHTVVEYVKDILRGYEIVCFSNPLESFSSLSSAGLIILDYALPGMDGIEYLKFVKRDFPKVPVILITGQGSEDVCLTAFHLGVKDYLKKPFSPIELRDAVRSCVKRKSGSRTHAAVQEEISPEVLNRVYLAKKFIDDNADKNLQLNEVLKVACMSKSGFCKSFKIAFGTTFKDYFLERRIEKAKDLLRGGQSVTEVASNLNYADSSYFARIFKKVEGISPSLFVRQGPDSTN
jgi:two-component system response regulator YesN